MVEWKVVSPAEEEKTNRQKLGDAEYDRRLAIVNNKADELHNKGDWEEAMIMRPQFESVAMACSIETLAKLENKPGSHWARLVYKLAGVN